MTQFYGLKFWASHPDRDVPDTLDCTCGKSFPTGGSLALATHIYKDWEARGTDSKCAPLGLQTWEDPDVLREAMAVDERDATIIRLEDKLCKHLATIEDLKSRMNEARKLLA